MDKTRKAILANIACVVVVMALAVLVRCPSSMLIGATPEEQAAYTTEQGLPYLIDMDSYYHVRIVDNDIDHGSMGDSFLEDGTAWDTQSFYPKGRTAEYQPGIVKLAEATWGVARLFGVSLYQVEYVLAALMAALAGLVAFLLGYRMSGRIGGLVAGVLVACAPGFVARTVFGRYDTDMFVVLMDVLMVFMLTEALRAWTVPARVAFSLGFGLSVLAYALCWAPQYALLFAGVFLLGGLLFVVALLAAPKRPDDARGRLRQWAARPEPQGLVLCLVFAVAAILILREPGFFTQLASTLLWTVSPLTTDVLPNMFVAVSELVVPAWVPPAITQWFAGYVPGMQLTVLNGVGGIVPALLSLVGLAWLAFRGVKRAPEGNPWPLDRRTSIMYFIVVGLFLVAGLYAIGRGVRFIEHLSIPVGVLAGACAGWFALRINAERWGNVYIAPVFTAILCVAALAPSVVGSAQISSAMHPSTSDASAQGMAWVRDNATDPQAVIVSWWDDGYFYESASGHPCLWDGGSMDGVRSILVGKLLTTDDAELSASIIRMLAYSGNRPIELLMEHADAKTAFDAVWEALPLPQDQAIHALEQRCSLTAAQAAEVESLLHPAEPKESYLVLTNSMLTKTAWYEYFANWDFTGNALAPSANGNRLDASSQEKRRQGEVFRCLLQDGDSLGPFTLVFDSDDGINRMAIWQVAPKEK